MMDISHILWVLECCEFFKILKKSDHEKIAVLCEPKIYGPGEFVFRQGDFGEHLYIIEEGQIFLERSMDLGSRKGRAVIGTLGRGRVFGCWSTLLNEPHNLMSSAICQRQTKVVALRGADLREMMLVNKDLGFKVLERLCFLLRDRIQGALGAMEKI